MKIINQSKNPALLDRSAGFFISDLFFYLPITFLILSIILLLTPTGGELSFSFFTSGKWDSFFRFPDTISSPAKDCKHFFVQKEKNRDLFQDPGFIRTKKVISLPYIDSCRPAC